MKILYITYEGFDTPNPNNQMAEVMINDFLDNGYDVHLIQSSKKKIYDELPNSLIGRKNFSYDTVKRNVVDKTKFVKRYLNEIRYAFLAMKKWIKVKDVDVVYVQSNPVVVFTILLLKIFKRKPIVYSIYDVFPGHAYDIGVIKSKFLYNVLRIIQKPCYMLSDAITVLSDDMKEIISKEGAKDNKIYIVPAWFDEKTTKPIPSSKNRFIQKYRIPQDKFYVQFAGTIGLIFNYKTVLEVAKRLKNEKNIRFQIIGEGNVKEKFIKKAKEMKLKNIDFYPIQPVEMVPDVYNACSICIIPLMKGVIGNGVPSKAPILMRLKKVIVNCVESSSNYSKMFKENNMGLAYEIDSYDEIAEGIKYLYNNEKEVKIMAENAYNYSKEIYKSSTSTKKIMNIFDSFRR